MHSQISDSFYVSLSAFLYLSVSLTRCLSDSSVCLSLSVSLYFLFCHFMHGDRVLLTDGAQAEVAYQTRHHGPKRYSLVELVTAQGSIKATLSFAESGTTRRPS